MVHWTSWIFTLMFHQNREVLGYYFFKYFSASFFPPLISSLFWTTSVHMLLCLMLSYRFLKLHIFLQPSFCFLDWIILLICFKVYWFCLLHSQICWVPLVEFSYQTLNIWTPKFFIWFFFIIFVILLRFLIGWLIVVMFYFNVLNMIFFIFKTYL